MSTDGITPDMVPWDEGDAAPMRKLYPILSPRPGELLRAILLGDKVVGVRTHWVDSRTVPCIAPRSKCRGCEQWNRRLWKGYIAALLLPCLRLGIFEYTRGAVDEIGWDALRPPRGLRGMYATLRRPPGKAQGRVHAALSAPPAEWRNLDLPPAFAVKEELWEIWSAPGLPSGQDDGPGDGEGTVIL